MPQQKCSYLFFKLNLDIIFPIRLHELVATGDGLAIIEQGMTLGGGELQHFGVNSNTSARGFLKCAYKKRELTSNNTDNGDNNNKNSNKKAAEKASPA